MWLDITATLIATQVLTFGACRLVEALNMI
jgi:hypothetical protein